MVETLLATALFCLVFVVFMDIWPVQARAVNLSRDVLTASCLAAQEMESTVSTGYVAAADRTGTVTVRSAADGRGATVVFTYTVTVTTQADTNKFIVVLVQWAEGTVRHGVEMQTLLANPS